MSMSNENALLFCHCKLLGKDDWKPSSFGNITWWLESSGWFSHFSPNTPVGCSKVSSCILRAGGHRRHCSATPLLKEHHCYLRRRNLWLFSTTRNTGDAFVLGRMLNIHAGVWKTESLLLLSLNYMALKMSFFAKSRAMLDLQHMFHVFEKILQSVFQIIH